MPSLHSSLSLDDSPLAEREEVLKSDNLRIVELTIYIKKKKNYKAKEFS